MRSSRGRTLRQAGRVVKKYGEISSPANRPTGASWGGFRSWQAPWAGVAGSRVVQPAVAPRGGTARPWLPNAALSGGASSAGAGRAEREKPAGFLGAQVRASLALLPTGGVSAPCGLARATAWATPANGAADSTLAQRAAAFDMARSIPASVTTARASATAHGIGTGKPTGQVARRRRATGQFDVALYMVESIPASVTTAAGERQDHDVADRYRRGARRAAPARRGARRALPASRPGLHRASTPPPRRGARCRPRAAPIVRCVKFTPDCRRDLRRIVANVEGAAVLTCGRCPPVSGRARRRPASLQRAITGLMHGSMLARKTVTSHKRRKSRLCRIQELCTVQESLAAQPFLADLTPLCPHLGRRRRVTVWIASSRCHCGCGHPVVHAAARGLSSSTRTPTARCGQTADTGDDPAESSQGAIEAPPPRRLFRSSDQFCTDRWPGTIASESGREKWWQCYWESSCPAKGLPRARIERNVAHFKRNWSHALSQRLRVHHGYRRCIADVIGSPRTGSPAKRRLTANHRDYDKLDDSGGPWSMAHLQGARAECLQ